MINNNVKKHGEFEIVVHMKAKLEIMEHKIACRYCQIETKYSGNISNFSDHLRRKHSAVSLSFFFVTSITSFSHKSMLSLSIKIMDINFVDYVTQMSIISWSSR